MFEKIWFKEMLDREIEEVKGTIRNQELWVLGSNQDTAELLQENLSHLYSYLNMLVTKSNKLKEELL